MAPGTYSASKIGEAAASASDKLNTGGPKVKANEKAYNSALRNLPDKAKAWEDLLLARRSLAARGASGA